MSTRALLFCYLLIAVTHFFYYPKWQQSGTEATISYDVSGYYMYLPAAFIYDDLKQVAFLPAITEKYHPSYDPYQAFDHESGTRVMKYSLGQSVMYAPFFAVAHVWAKNSDAYPADGFSRPYQLMISLGSLLVAFLGLWLVMTVLKYYFADRVVALTLLVLCLATTYLNYTAIDGAMTHNNVFTLYALLLYLTHHFYRSPNVLRAAAIGLTIGLMALTRPTEILAVVIPLAWGLAEWKGEYWSKKIAFLKSNFPKLVVAAACCLAVGSLQLFYWKYVSGDWIVYSYQDQGFDWFSPHIIDGMFSYKAGWLTYTPVMVFALVGFWPLYRRRPEIFAPAAPHTFLFIYVAFAWSVWWYGGSLGQRTMVQAYAVLSLPLAAFISWVLSGPKWLRWLFLIIGLFCTAHNLWFTHQAHRGGLFFTEQMNRAYYWRTLFTFEENPEDQLLFDNPESYTGTPAKSDTLYFNALDDRSTAACGMDPVGGAGALCLLEREENSPEFRVDLPLGRRQWIRATADIKINARRGSRDNSAQMVLRFYRDGEMVKQRIIRMHRVLNEDWWRPMTIDARAPWDGADAVSITFWNGGSSQPAMVVDNVRLLKLD